MASPMIRLRVRCKSISNDHWQCRLLTVQPACARSMSGPIRLQQPHLQEAPVTAFQASSHNVNAVSARGRRPLGRLAGIRHPALEPPPGLLSRRNGRTADCQADRHVLSFVDHSDSVSIPSARPYAVSDRRLTKINACSPRRHTINRGVPAMRRVHGVISRPRNEPSVQGD